MKASFLLLSCVYLAHLELDVPLEDRKFLLSTGCNYNNDSLFGCESSPHGQHTSTLAPLTQNQTQLCPLQTCPASCASISYHDSTLLKLCQTKKWKNLRCPRWHSNTSSLLYIPVSIDSTTPGAVSCPDSCILTSETSCFSNQFLPPAWVVLLKSTA